MNRKRKEPMDAAKSNVSTFPALVSIAEEHTERRKAYSWIDRRLLELGIKAMADKPTPPGLYVNFSTASFFILVLGTMAGLWWFTWQTANQAGYDRGVNETEKRILLERVEKAEEDAKKAMMFGAAGSSKTGHEEPKKEVKR